MINKVIKFISSMQFMSLLILIFACSIGYATFIENDFGRSSAKALIYNTWWFELILILLVYNLMNNILRYKLFRLSKLPVLLLHLSFVVILIGSGITRYISFEGMMHIREGESANQFISDDTFLQIHVNDKKHQLNYDKKLFLSAISRNSFSTRLDFKDRDIKISYVDFIANPIDSVFTNVNDGDQILHLVVPGPNGMHSEYLSNKEQRIIKGELFTFNNPLEGAINIFSRDDDIVCNTDYSVETMSMNTRETNAFQPLTDFVVYKRTLHIANGLNFVLKDVLKDAKINKVSSSNVMEDGVENLLIVRLNVDGEEKLIELYGGKGFQSEAQFFAIQDLNFKISYGSKYYFVPFMIQLRDFQLERYPGSESPSSYAAEITVIDDEKNIPYRIFMNNVLQYRGYRFFQSSYDKDEKGTILSVNHDFWGTLVSYIGYGLLLIAMILILLMPNTRFSDLSKKLNKLKSASLILLILFISNTNISAYDIIDEEHIVKFDQLVVQDNGGRLEPVNTLCSEFLRKVYGKSTYKDLSSTQVILGMMHDPVSWNTENIIKVSNAQLRSIVGDQDLKSRYLRTSFNNFFDSNGAYILSKLVEEAYATLPAKRSEFEKDVIKVDERVNICFAIFNGGLFRFFPLVDDQNNTWFTYKEHYKFSGNDSLFVANIIPMYFQSLQEGMDSGDWSRSDSIVNYISKFQSKYGKEVIPPKSNINLELLYNKLNVFSNLFIFYFSSGFILLILVLIGLFHSNKLLHTMINLFKWLIIIGFLIHSAGLTVRWIISGHAPWSNGYESMIYIAWATVASGLVFSRRSLLTLSATAIVSALILMVAHLNWLDPEITNLVPVLKSYWLMIHVAIIVASYGFLALGAFLGLLSLWLIIFTNNSNKVKLKHTLSELTLINERSLQIGLFMLTIGTFLGGVWANESWGRYWGWDPKETWALTSVLIYAFVLHMRFIPSLKGKLIFNIVSMFAIWTIFMTYFGVNYYLSGLHSYAAGDPMPIPSFIYYLLALMIITTIFGRMKYKKYYL